MDWLVGAGGLAASVLAAVAAREIGLRAARPVPRFCAGGAGLVAGWTVLESGSTLPQVACLALLAAGLMVKPPPVPVKIRKAAPPSPPPRVLDERLAWLSALSAFGGWWLAGGAWAAPLPALAGAVAILAAGLLAYDAWSVAAAAVSLWAALMAVGAGTLAMFALPVAGAALGGGPLLVLAVGLGEAMARPVAQALLHGHYRLGLVVLSPLGCLLLMRWWRHRFMRFRRAADAVRALAAVAVMALLGFSAAAMQGLR